MTTEYWIVKYEFYAFIFIVTRNQLAIDSVVFFSLPFQRSSPFSFFWSFICSVYIVFFFFFPSKRNNNSKNENFNHKFTHTLFISILLPASHKAINLLSNIKIYDLFFFLHIFQNSIRVFILIKKCLRLIPVYVLMCSLSFAQK